MPWGPGQASGWPMAGPPDSAARHHHRLHLANQRRFVLGERETWCLARKVCDLEKEPVSRRQVCWK